MGLQGAIFRGRVRTSSSRVGTGVVLNKGEWVAFRNASCVLVVIFMTVDRHSQTFAAIFYIALASALIATALTAWLIRKVRS
jgi:hypothetical protein